MTSTGYRHAGGFTWHFSNMGFTETLRNLHSHSSRGFFFRFYPDWMGARRVQESEPQAHLKTSAHAEQVTRGVGKMVIAGGTNSQGGAGGPGRHPRPLRNGFRGHRANMAGKPMVPPRSTQRSPSGLAALGRARMGGAGRKRKKRQARASTSAKDVFTETRGSPPTECPPGSRARRRKNRGRWQVVPAATPRKEGPGLATSILIRPSLRLSAGRSIRRPPTGGEGRCMGTPPLGAAGVRRMPIGKATKPSC